MTDEALKRAREIAEREAPAILECLFGGSFSGTVERVLIDGLRSVALAAILDTSERAAQLQDQLSAKAEAIRQERQRNEPEEASYYLWLRNAYRESATALRNGDHLRSDSDV